MSYPSASLRDLQGDLAWWHEWKWGRPSLPLLAAKLAEETGEVCEAVVKTEQGHPKAEELDLAGELADVVVVAMVLSWRAGIDLQSHVAETVAAHKRERQQETRRHRCGCIKRDGDGTYRNRPHCDHCCASRVPEEWCADCLFYSDGEVA